MSSLIPGSCFIQDAMRMCFGFVFVGLAISVYPAQSEEGFFAPNLDILTIQDSAYISCMGILFGTWRGDDK